MAVGPSAGKAQSGYAANSNGYMYRPTPVATAPSQTQSPSSWGPAPAAPSYAPPPPPPSSAPAPAVNLQANTSEALDALTKRYMGNLDDIKGNSGYFMDLAGSKIRDAREGGRTALQQDAAFAGKASDPSIAAYDADTQRAQAGAIADVAAQREGIYTGAIAGGVNVASAAPRLALDEKQLQVNAYNAQQAATQAAAMNDFSRWRALLDAQRGSPIYQGY